MIDQNVVEFLRTLPVKDRRAIRDFLQHGGPADNESRDGPAAAPSADLADDIEPGDDD